MASNLSKAQWTTLRDNTYNAIVKITSGAVSEYDLGDRKVKYQDLEDLQKALDFYNKQICLLETGKNQSRGYNRVDMSKQY